MKRRLSTALLTSAIMGIPGLALALEQGAELELPRLGMATGEPQQQSAAPSLPFAVPPATFRDYVLDFHGYLQLPFRAGIHQRENPDAGQGRYVLHSPALVPEDFRRFEYTGVVPNPWAQFGFTYGNSVISGTMIIASSSLTDAQSIYSPTEQVGITDAYIRVNLSDTMKMPFEVKVGGVTGRYGAMGAFDSGRYATPLFARTNQVGEVITAGFKLGNARIVLEQGAGGQVGRAARTVVSDAWNGYANTYAGSSFVSHLHAGIGYADVVQGGFHYITAWSADDQGVTATLADGRISVFGADARLTAGRFGHLYAGFARTTASNSHVVSGIIEVLNARGGGELTSGYFGPNSNGNGSLTTVGAQYDLSFARLAFGQSFHGKSPDILLSLFGIGTKVSSNDKSRGCNSDGSNCHPLYDGALKLKAGGEATYNMLSWFGMGARFDHVRQHNDFNRKAYSIWTVRLLAHTGWRSRDEVALQYSRFVYGNDVVVRTGMPPIPDRTANPDKDVFTLTGTFWW